MPILFVIQVPNINFRKFDVKKCIYYYLKDNYYLESALTYALKSLPNNDSTHKFE
jgi:hypothetical protein